MAASLGVLVSQSSERGGAMNAYRFALEQRSQRLPSKRMARKPSGNKVIRLEGPWLPESNSASKTFQPRLPRIELTRTRGQNGSACCHPRSRRHRMDSLPWYAQVAGLDPVRVSRAMEDLAPASLLRGSCRTRAIPRPRQGGLQSGEPQLACFPGVIEALSQLRAHGLKLAAATNLPSWMADPMATAAEIMPLLGALVDFGATSRNKPDPEPLIEALRRLDVRQRLRRYVGDRERQDAVAASAGESMVRLGCMGHHGVCGSGGNSLDTPPARRPREAHRDAARTQGGTFRTGNHT